MPFVCWFIICPSMGALYALFQESAEGSSDSCERNKTSPCGLAITEFKLLDSILSVASGNFRKAARIANLMSSSGKSSAGRPRSGAGASKKDLFSRKNAARSEGVGAYLSMASRSHPSHKRLDQASSSDDGELSFSFRLPLFGANGSHRISDFLFPFFIHHFAF